MRYLTITVVFAAALLAACGGTTPPPGQDRGSGDESPMVTDQAACDSNGACGGSRYIQLRRVNCHKEDEEGGERRRFLAKCITCDVPGECEDGPVCGMAGHCHPESKCEDLQDGDWTCETELVQPYECRDCLYESHCSGTCTRRAQCIDSRLPVPR